MRVCSIVLAAALLGATVSVPVQAAEEPADERRDGLPLPERLDRALRDMMEDVQPKLEDALDYLRSFGAIDDPRHYEMPEVLPNGDIIIRRREDAPDLRSDPPAPPPGAPPRPDGPAADPGAGVWT